MRIITTAHINFVHVYVCCACNMCLSWGTRVSFNSKLSTFLFEGASRCNDCFFCTYIITNYILFATPPPPTHTHIHYHRAHSKTETIMPYIIICLPTHCTQLTFRYSLKHFPNQPSRTNLPTVPVTYQMYMYKSLGEHTHNCSL